MRTVISRYMTIAYSIYACV